MGKTELESIHIAKFIFHTISCAEFTNKDLCSTY